MSFPGSRRDDETLPYLLGVLWSYFTDRYPVLDESGKATGSHIDMWNGLAGVVPASELLWLLNTETLVAQRDKIEGEAVGHGIDDVLDSGPAEPAFHDDRSSLERTGNLMKGLLQVPKGDADEVHRGHQA